jgi:hypothetical protein
MGHQRQIDDVRMMSACPSTPDVSLRRGECRKGPISTVRRRLHKDCLASDHFLEGYYGPFRNQQVMMTELHCKRGGDLQRSAKTRYVNLPSFTMAKHLITSRREPPFERPAISITWQKKNKER